MKMGWKARGVLILFLSLVNVTATLYGSYKWLQVKVLNTDQKVKKWNKNVRLKMTTNEIVGVEFVVHVSNSSGDDYSMFLIKDWRFDLPEWVEGWKDKYVTLPSGRIDSLRTVAYIHPVSAGVDSFMIWYGYKGKNFWSGNWFTVYIEVTESQYPRPVVLKEPAYTPGLSNTVFWVPVKGNTLQEIYYFDVDDRENLEKSVRRFYKISGTDTLQAFFTGLKSGHTYGYIAKIFYETPIDTLSLYSNTVYSTQDNIPPSRVTGLQALLKPGRGIEVSWNTVTDSISGVAFYKIYRAVDTGYEKLVADSVTGEDAKAVSLKWVDTSIDSGITYYYRVRAVDKVGNEGDGERSNGITATENGSSSEDLGGNTTPASSANYFYHKGSIDTVWIKLDGGETGVRFQAVRDNISYFVFHPNLGMRYFESGRGYISPDTLRKWGWVSAADPDSVFFIFDYANYNGISIDPNFVSGHSYFRRVIREYSSNTDTTRLGKIIPDCFSPEDIRNLRIEAVINDPDFQNPAMGYTRWAFKLSWDPATDALSGLKRYHVYRYVEEIDTGYIELDLPKDFTKTSLRDSLVSRDNTIANPIVFYKVVAEDNAGNLRDLKTTDWEVHERALSGPLLTFTDTNLSDIYPHDPAKVDTIFTRQNFVIFKLKNFDTQDVTGYIVSINGSEVTPASIVSKDTLIVNLPSDEVLKIKVRALYAGRRSSVWSPVKVVIRGLNKPPYNFTVWNDSTYWKGHIYMKWERSSLDVMSYLVWRDSSLVGIVKSTDKADINWTDFYGRNELTGQPGDTLWAYRMYHYKVQAINVLGDTSDFSSIDSAYCNRPDFVDSNQVKIENGKFIIVIYWKRPYPNLVSDNYTTIVRVYQDSLTQLVATDTVTDDKTWYTYSTANPGHNYIFQVKEFPNNLVGRSSGWSQPYTVSLRTLKADILSQPRGKIFVKWDSTLVDSFKVSSFLLRRTLNKQISDMVLSNKVFSYMDSSSSLKHGRIYNYNIFALDSLNQVIAANTMSAICDTGSVFIPEILPFPGRYFNNSDSVSVSWVWHDPDGKELDDTTRGADSLKIEVSLHNKFPSLAGITESTGWFPADVNNRSKKVKIPKAVSSSNNKIVYFRITAKDKYGHPSEDLWSTDFYKMKTAIYDTVPPRLVKNFVISSSEAYYKVPDSIIVHLEWNDSSLFHRDSLVIDNIAFYRILRSYNGYQYTIGIKPARADVVHYSFSDTLKNAEYKWQIISVDSAGNSTYSGWIGPNHFLETPFSPNPEGFKKCSLQYSAPDSTDLEYFFEIAMSPDHFRLAYEMGVDEIGSRLLCRSGWIDSTGFICTSGWGAIVMDTTWFRVKVRQDTIWESGWSSVAYYTENEGNPPGKDKMNPGNDIPTDFEVKQNFPNPFNSQTVISYKLPEAASIKIRVYSIIGTLVRTLVEENQSAGSYSVVWNGRDDWGRSVATGIYLTKIIMKTDKGETFEKMIKMMMIK